MLRLEIPDSDNTTALDSLVGAEDFSPPGEASPAGPDEFAEPLAIKHRWLRVIARALDAVGRDQV